jgi:hypothetical protein
MRKLSSQQQPQLRDKKDAINLLFFVEMPFSPPKREQHDG